MTGDPRDEVLVLRERVRVLAAGLGLDENFEVPAEVRRLARAGRSLHAIRELRRLTPGRLGLTAAKRMVDALQR